MYENNEVSLKIRVHEAQKSAELLEKKALRIGGKGNVLSYGLWQVLVVGPELILLSDGTCAGVTEFFVARHGG